MTVERRDAEVKIREVITAHTARSADGIPGDVRFRDLGIESSTALAILADLGEWLGRALSPTVWWTCSTVDALADHLAGVVRHGDPEPARADIGATGEPVAIVGIGCRLPAAVDGPEALWDALVSGADGIREVPPERWDGAAWFDPDPAAPGRMSTRWGGFIDGVDRFDAAFFRISPIEARQMDPHQRITLEVAWHALEDAGIVPGSLAGRAVGVYVGAMWQGQYERATQAGAESIRQHSATARDSSIISARVAYALGLRGPALTVNTACSSSAMAVHLAATSIAAGDCEIALAGGVNLMLAPHATVEMSKFGAMSPDGQCRPFDAGANGYVRGEGAALVVLMPLSRALAEGRRTYAVLRGSAANNDGASNGLTAPDLRAQVEVLRAAWRRAGIDPGRVHYVETHGPGTILGDPIEATALGTVFGVERKAPLAIGSIKSNIGHLEAAAGAAGLAKAALAVDHGALPGNLHFDSPNPHIDFAALGLRVARGESPFVDDGPRLVGVSSFGFGGTNVHLALSDAPHRPQRAIALAAESEAGVRSLAADMRARVRAAVDDAALDATCRRVHGSGPARAVVLGRSCGGLGAGLKALAEGSADVSEASTPPRVVLVFGGSGGQWAGMTRDLLGRAPAFDRALARCDMALRPLVGWSVRAELAGRALPTATERIQPMIFAVQVALAQTLVEWGIRPDAVVGQSMGEVAAAVVAGALTVAEGARVVVTRSRLVTEMADGSGGLAVVDLSAGRAADLPGVELAGELAPTSSVVAGTMDALDALETHLADSDVTLRRVAAAYASHSSAMEPIAARLVDALGDLRGRAPAVRWWSTARESEISGSITARYWGDNLRRPVRLRSAIEHLVGPGPTAFVEVGPHPVLRSAIRATLDAADRSDDPVLATCWRDAPAGDGLRELAATLWCSGVPVEWDRVAGCRPSEPARVPLTLSARTADGLRAQARRWARWLEAHPDVPWQDIVATAALRRTHFAERAAVYASGAAPATVGLRRLADGEPHPAVQRGRAAVARPVAFVFSGQGGQWAGMGPAIARAAPDFPALVARCDAVFEALLGHRIGDALLDPVDPVVLDRVDLLQPALFVVAVGLAHAWQARGVTPDVVIGHSQGEVAAAVVGGALTIEQGATIMARRSSLLRGLSGTGAMAVVRSPLREIRAWMARVDPRLWLAVRDGPEAGVVAGPPSAISAFERALTAKDVFCRVVDVDYASHGPGVDPILGDLASALHGITPAPLRIPMVSTVTGRAIEGQALDGDYWCRNLRQPVCLDLALRDLLADGAAFVEISPHPLLSYGLGERAGRRAVVSSMRRDADVRVSLGAGVGQLYVGGVDIDWTTALDGGGHPPVPLPGYAFEPARHWMNGPARAGTTSREADEMDVTVTRDSATLPADVQAGVSAALAAVTGFDEGALDPDAGLMTLGIDSLMFMQIKNTISGRFGVELPNGLFFEEGTSTRTLAGYVEARLPGPASGPARLREAPVDVTGPDGVDGVSLGIARVMQQQLDALAELSRRQLATLERLGRGGAGASPTGPARAAEAPPTARPEPDRGAGRDVFVPFRPIRRDGDDDPTDHLGELVERYTSATPTSKARTDADRRVFANNRNIAGFTPATKEMTYQIIAERAQGAYVWDLDGNRYVDVTMGFGSCILGHDNPLIADAIRAQMSKSWAVGPIADPAGAVARRLSALTGLERVAFYNSGTEAVMVALRLARTATGRPKVVVFEGSYHGMFESVLALRARKDGAGAAPMAPGVPESMVADTIVLPYADPAVFEAIEVRGDQIAAVLVESVQSRRPDVQPRNFLHGLRALTTRIGAALIFDEVVTGFRTGPAGAQGYFGVRADIATYGKVVGGGMPVGIVAGSARFLDGVDGGMWRFGDDSVPEKTNTFVAGTFCSHPLSMAASRAVLDHMADQGPMLQVGLDARTRALCVRLNTVFAEARLPIHVTQFGSLFRYVVPRAYELLYYRLIAEGIYIWEGRNCFLSTAHSDADLDAIVDATRAAAAWLAESIRPGAIPSGFGVLRMPATAAQRAMYARCTRAGGDRGYHVPVALRVKGPLRAATLAESVGTLVHRHPALRTAFVVDADGRLWQQVHPVGDWGFEAARLPEDVDPVDDAATEAWLDAFVDRVCRPFDVSRPELVRCGVATLADDDHLVVLDVHHLVCDGVSIDRLVDTLWALYAGGAPPLPEADYADFVAWEKAYLEGPRREQDAAFWAAKAGPPMALPADRDEPVRAFEGAFFEFELPADPLRGFARRNGVTLHILMGALFRVFCRAVTGQDDVCFGSPTAGRPEGRFGETVGLFIGTLVHRARVGAERTFADILAETRADVLAMLEAQHHPFERTAAVMGATPAAPPFEVGFSFEASPGRAGRVVGDGPDAVRVSPRPVAPRGSSMDVVFEILDDGSDLHLRFAYNPRRFDRETVAGWRALFERCARGALASPDRPIASIVSTEEPPDERP